MCICAGGAPESTGEQHHIFKWLPEQGATELRILAELSGAPIMFFGDAIRPAVEKRLQRIFGQLIAEAETLARGEESRPGGA